MARRNALNPSVESEYQNAMSWLKDISTGKANIALPQLDGTFDTSNATKFQHGATYGSLF
jgi:phage gp36-like protein